MMHLDRETSPQRALPFVIFMVGRTGSSHLTQSLNAHPEIKAQGEGLGRLQNEKRDAAAQLAWARQAFEPQENLSAAGFKAKGSQAMKVDGLKALLGEIGPRVIHMGRRNVVKHAISGMRVPMIQDQEGRANMRQAKHGEQRTLPPSTIDPDDLVAEIQGIEIAQHQLDEYVSDLALPTLRVFYEDLLAHEDETFRSVMEFLEVPPQPLSSRVRKATPDDLRDAVSNFDEVLDALRGTAYEAMLSESSRYEVR